MCIICRHESIIGLKILDCSFCPLLTKIPNIEGLKKLYCNNCPLLTEIFNIKGLKYLDCFNCPLLTEIPNIEGLKYLYCYNCSWLKQNNKDFEKNLKKLIRCQVIFKKILIKKRKFIYKYVSSELGLTNIILNYL